MFHPSNKQKQIEQQQQQLQLEKAEESPPYVIEYHLSNIIHRRRRHRPKRSKSHTDAGDAGGLNIYKFKLKMANTLSVMTNVLRNVVSKQRIRYKEKGFNLDLAYICDNIIAMGYPADNIESIYRNRLEDVYKFLEENHHDHYKIYNLCLERSYDINKFHGRVAVYPFEDHNPPTIELIQKFCGDVDNWLKKDAQNVAAVHCKAGKGRTGTMICCYLLYSGQQSTAEDALACYDEKRTKDRKGVTIPSQRRYVQYFSNLIRSGVPYEKRTLQFCEIRFTEANLLHGQGTVHCSISVLQDTSCAVKVQPLQTFTIDFRKSFTLDIRKPALCVAGDIKVELTHKTSRKKIFHFWFNTFFVCDAAVIEGEGNDIKFVYTLNKCEIDDAHKDREHKCFSEDFKVQLVFFAESSCEKSHSNEDDDVSYRNINHHRKSQNARLQQNNYALPQNSSSGSDLNYIYDQKSSSSAASVSSSMGGGGGGSGSVNAGVENFAFDVMTMTTTATTISNSMMTKATATGTTAMTTTTGSTSSTIITKKPERGKFRIGINAVESTKAMMNASSTSASSTIYNHMSSSSSSASAASSSGNYSSCNDQRGGAIVNDSNMKSLQSHKVLYNNHLPSSAVVNDAECNHHHYNDIDLDVQQQHQQANPKLYNILPHQQRQQQQQQQQHFFAATSVASHQKQQTHKTVQQQQQYQPSTSIPTQQQQQQQQLNHHHHHRDTNSSNNKMAVSPTTTTVVTSTNSTTSTSSSQLHTTAALQSSNNSNKSSSISSQSSSSSVTTAGHNDDDEEEEEEEDWESAFTAARTTTASPNSIDYTLLLTTTTTTTPSSVGSASSSSPSSIMRTTLRKLSNNQMQQHQHQHQQQNNQHHHHQHHYHHQQHHNNNHNHRNNQNGGGDHNEIENEDISTEYQHTTATSTITND